MYRAQFIILVLASVLSSCVADDLKEGAAENKGAANFKGELKASFSWGGSLADNAASLVQLSDGSLAVLGTTLSTDGDVITKTRTGEDYWLLHLDKNAGVLWSKTYGGSRGDVATDLISTRDGGFLMGGYSMSADGDGSKNEGFHDNWFVKTNASGAIEWEKSYGFAGHDHSYSILQTEDGGFFSAGFLDVTASGGAGNETVKHGVGEFWGQKLDVFGDLEWRNYFGGSSNDRAHKAVQTSDGGFALFGFTESSDFDISQSNGSYDFWMVKLDSKGNLLWDKSYGGSGIDQAYDALVLKDGGFLLVGQSFSADGDIKNAKGGSDAWVIRTDASGNILWEKSYGGSDFDFAQAVTQGPDDSFFILGNSRSADGQVGSNKGSIDMWVFQIDASGKLLWQKSFGGPEIELGADLLFTQDGILNILGSSESPVIEGARGKGNFDIVLLQMQ